MWGEGQFLEQAYKRWVCVPQWLNTDPAQFFLALGETGAVGQGVNSVSNCIFYKLGYPDHAAQSQNAGGY